MRNLFTLVILLLSFNVHASSISCDSYLKKVSHKKTPQFSTEIPLLDSIEPEILAEASIQADMAFARLHLTEKLEIERLFIDLEISKIELTQQYVFSIYRSSRTGLRTLLLPYARLDIIPDGQFLNALILFSNLTRMFPETEIQVDATQLPKDLNIVSLLNFFDHNKRTIDQILKNDRRTYPKDKSPLKLRVGAPEILNGAIYNESMNFVVKTKTHLNFKKLFGFATADISGLTLQLEAMDNQSQR